MRRLVLVGLLVTCCTSAFASGKRPVTVVVDAPATVTVAVEPAKPAQIIVPDFQKPRIQIALLLDTSGSMSGMITQAKNQLWSIVNEFITANHKGVKPRIEVALYRYGTPSLGAKTGYIKQLVEFTDDLDRIGEELFALKTSGGDEYCGWAMKTALDELEWTKNPADYRVIFIAGNESFGQGPVEVHDVCKRAVKERVIVNTIHCSGGADDGWAEAAKLTGGKALRIETNRVVIEIKTPYDDELIKLNTAINDTYIAYGGVKGTAAKGSQMRMDQSAQSFGAANIAKRTKTKGSALYRNASWDLVDADREEQVDLKNMKKEDLPEEMREMDADEREAYVAKKAKERLEIQKKIADLSKKRDAFIAKNQEKLEGNESTLGEQVRKTVRSQAEASGFDF